MDEIYYRAVINIEQAEKDFKRGYSYHQLEEYSDKQVEEMDANGELEQLPNGDWVVPLDGLCGFSSPERIKYFVNNSCFGHYIAIFKGRHIGFVYDGELFKPEKLLKVVHIDKFEEFEEDI